MANGKMFILGIIGIVVVVGGIILLMFFGSYNGLVKKSEAVTDAWADVESQYQRRADLIPNLVEVVKQNAEFEKGVLTDVTEARSKASSIQINANELTEAKIQEYQAAQSQLSGALSRLLATVENYPELRANEAFQNLQTQLERTENRIQHSRESFNGMVQSYNTAIKKFPGLIVASFAGFEEKAYFKADEGASKAPDVGEMFED